MQQRESPDKVNITIGTASKKRERSKSKIDLSSASNKSKMGKLAISDGEDLSSDFADAEYYNPTDFGGEAHVDLITKAFGPMPALGPPELILPGLKTLDNSNIHD